MHISSSVTKIGNCVFNSCYQLKAINVDVSNANYVSVDGILFNKNKTKLILCPPMCISTSYVVPPHIEEIETAAFFGCTKLKKIKLPNSVKNIGNNAFDECSSLHTIFVPKGEIQRFTIMNALKEYSQIIKEDNNLLDNPTIMKKFFFCACGVSAIVVAICAIIFTVYEINYDRRSFNVNISGTRNGASYTIKGNLPPSEVSGFVKKKTDELKTEPKNPFRRY